MQGRNPERRGGCCSKWMLRNIIALTVSIVIFFSRGLSGSIIMVWVSFVIFAGSRCIILSVAKSQRSTRSGQQFGKIIIDAGYSEVRLTLEWLAQVMDTVAILAHELDNCQNKIIWFVE